MTGHFPAAVTAAAARIAPFVARTPLLEAATLNELVSRALGLRALRVFVKAENLQHTGAFKFRGATNKLLLLSPEQKDRGVVAFSSGNFAQALALASHNLGVRCTIVSPHDAPQLKLQRTRSYGATVVTTIPAPGENREVCAAARARAIADETGATLLHPFDDWDVIHGQGSIALEIFEQAGCRLNSLVVPCGGGGMLAGCSLATSLVSPQTRLFAVEPEAYNDHCLSFNSSDRCRMSLPSGSQLKSICDALQANAPGELTWSVNKTSLSGACSMSDSEAVAAMKIAFTELKLVLEPSAALGLAALMNGKVGGLADGDAVAVVASGGNISIEEYVKLMSHS
ncbi:unnamed protein product, partial [Ectocarpus fasciculatus]